MMEPYFAKYLERLAEGHPVNVISTPDKTDPSSLVIEVKVGHLSRKFTTAQQGKDIVKALGDTVKGFVWELSGVHS